MGDYDGMWPPPKLVPEAYSDDTKRGPYAPTFEMVCDAVHLTIDGTVRIFNVHRLRHAIDLLDGGQVRSAATELRRRYPPLSPSDVTRYLMAAQRCIDYDVTV